MRILDLSMTIGVDMPGVDIRPAKTLENDGWNATTLELYSHSGTHVDAPVHFGASPQSIDQMPPDAFTAECWLVDCPVDNPSALIQLDMLGAIRDQVQKGDGLVFHTRWSKRYGTPAYRNELPRISEELAHWMVAQGIKLIGVEPPSVADVNNIEEVTKIHEILLGAGITIVEGLTNLESIGVQKFRLLALPLKIKNGDGCPTRAVAIL